MRLHNASSRAVSDFLAAWAAACDAHEAALKAMSQAARSKLDCTPRARWEQGARELARELGGVDLSWLSVGFLVWRPERESGGLMLGEGDS